MAYQKFNSGAGASTGAKKAGSGGYDPKVDKVLNTFGAEVGECKIESIVYSYDGREPKAQLHRRIKNKETQQFIPGKLGRFNKEELKALSLLIKQTYDSM